MPLKVDHHGIFSVLWISFDQDALSVITALFHWGWQSWGKFSLCDLNMQHNPVHVVHHTYACQKHGDRLHFVHMRLHASCVMNACPAAWQAKGHGVLVKEAKGAGWHDNSTSTKLALFSHMSLSWERRECRRQKCHDEPYPAKNRMLLAWVFLDNMLPTWNCNAAWRADSIAG